MHIFTPMFFRVAIAMLLCIAGASAAGPNLSKPTLMAIAAESARDNISSGWCGRGMLSLLNKAGLGEGLKGNNGQDWEKNLLDAGWKPVTCKTPMQAPLGSVLVYLGDARLGKRPRGTPGGYYGHVEMVALGFTGQRLYVADSPRVLPGGSVRDNFTGFWNTWKYELVQRDYTLLDEIHPNRIKSVEEWLKREDQLGRELGKGSLWERVQPENLYSTPPVLKMAEDKRTGRL